MSSRFVLDLFARLAVASFTLLEVNDGVDKVLLGKFGPVLVGKVELAISNLPQQVVANAQVAASALAAKDPLESEQILLDYEFELLDTLVGLHTFDDQELFGYALKLKLLERKSCFEQEKGQAEFEHLFDQVQQRVYSL